MRGAAICRALEILRWTGVIAGFQLAFTRGQTPVEQVHILVPWLVVSLAGLTGIESVFFGKAASQSTGYAPSGYQRQSGMNNLALAATALLVYFFKWGFYAELAVVTALLIFLFLSALNHGWSAWREGNRRLKNFMRPVMTLLLILFVTPFLWLALAFLQSR